MKIGIIGYGTRMELEQEGSEHAQAAYNVPFLRKERRHERR